MIANLKPYHRYKPSGIEWIGEVPEHWGIRRAKYLLHEVDERWLLDTGVLLSVSQYTGVTKRNFKENSYNPDTRAVSLIGYKKVSVNNLVINIMLAWNGSLGVSNFDGIVSPAYCVYKFKHGEARYYHYLLRSPLYKSEIKKHSTGVVESRLRLYTDKLYHIRNYSPLLTARHIVSSKK